MKPKNRRISVIMGELTTAISRIKASASAAYLEDELSMLTTSSNLAKDMLAFQALLVAASPDPVSYKELKAALEKNFVLGPAYQTFDLKIQARQAMMRGDVAALCALCLSTASAMRLLREPHTQVRCAQGLLLDSALEVISKLTAADVLKDPKDSPAKEVLLALNTEVQEFAKIPSFLVPQKEVREMLVLAGILNARKVSVDELLRCTEVVEESKGNPDAVSPLLRFLGEGNIGLKLVQRAEQVAQSRRGEVAGELGLAHATRTAEALVLAGPFYREVPGTSDVEVNLYAFTGNEFLGFCHALASGREVVKKMDDSRKVKQFSLALATEETKAWDAVKSSFSEMHKAYRMEIIERTQEALAADGLVDTEDGGSEIIDLHLLQEQVNCEAALATAVLTEEDAPKRLKVKELMQQNVAESQQLLEVAKVVLIFQCPRLASMYDIVPPSLSDIKQYQTVIAGWEVPPEFAKTVSAILACIVGGRNEELSKQVVSLLDSCLDGVAVKPAQIKELCGRLSAGAEATCFKAIFHVFVGEGEGSCSAEQANAARTAQYAMWRDTKNGATATRCISTCE